MSKDDLEVDLTKIKVSKDQIISFFKKYGIVFLILIPLLLSIYARMTPAGLPLADGWAQENVDAYYKNAFREQIKQQYPNLPDQNINKLVDENYAEYKKQNKDVIQQQTEQTADQLRSHFQDENGYTYMPDIDPYTYLRYARNYLDHGYIGDELRNPETKEICTKKSKDCVSWDNHMIAPKGRPTTKGPHPIVLAYMYKIMHIFNPKITLMQSATYFPIIFAALSIVPIFFIARMFAGNVGGFFAALIMAVNGAFLGRTTWGHADTDAYTIFFAVYFLLFFFLAIKAVDFKKILAYSVLAGFVVGLFSWFWNGWWYSFDFFLGMIGIYALYLLFFEGKFKSWNDIKQNQALKKFVLTAVVFIIASGIFVSIFSNPNTFVRSVMQPAEFSAIKIAGHASLWPNVYTTVAELNTASFRSIINTIGGNSFFYFSLLGILLLAFVKTEGRRSYIQYAILFILWYIGIFYASTKGIRFTMMLVPPLALAFGAAAGILYKKAAEYMKKLEISPKITGTIFIILLLLFVLPYAKGASGAVRGDMPMINDAWYESLNKIKMESEPDAIINSWWDFGHHFKYFADRRVTFDGASQNSPMAHWIGKVLLTSNEKEAVGILRMLDCGSNDAFEALNEEANDTPAAVKMLYEVIVKDKNQASSYLTGKGISKETIAKVLELTHCTPPENYFITSQDMVGKSGVWAHFGSWNFDKADIWINARNLPREEAIEHIKDQMKISEDEAKNVFFKIKGITNEKDANDWISPWPGYGDEFGCVEQDDKLICGGAIIDKATKDTQISTDKGIIKPGSIAYSDNGNFYVKEFEDGIDQSIMLLGTSKIKLVSGVMADSMFTRLFYYDGKGLNHFEKFSDKTSITGQRIIVWKVKW